MSRLLTAGFESGTMIGEMQTQVNASAVNGAIPSIQQTFKRSGNYASKHIVSAATGNRAEIDLAIPGGAVTNRTYFYRAYIYIESGGLSCTLMQIAAGASPAANAGIRVITDSSRRCSLSINGGAAIGLSSALNTGQWYRVEVGVNADIVNGTYALSIDGVSVTSGVQTAFISAPTYLCLNPTSLNNLPITCYFDDMAINDNQGASQNSLPGQGQIYILKPTADNAVASSWTNSSDRASLLPDGQVSNGFTITGSGDTANWQAVDELQTNLSLTNFLTASAVPSTSEMTFATASIPNNVTSVKVWYYLDSGANKRAMDLLLFRQGTTQIGTTQTVVPGTAGIGGAWRSVTFSGLNLTQSDVDSLQLRWSYRSTGGGSSGTVVIYANYLELTYVPSSTNLYDSVNNVPAVGKDPGEAQAGGGTQILNQTSTTTDNYDATLQTYVAAGIGHVPGIVYGAVRAGSGSNNVINGALQIVSTPTEASEVAFATTGSTMSDDADVGGGSGWQTFFTPPLDASGVDVNTAPVLRVGKRDASTSLLYVDQMFLLVETGSTILSTNYNKSTSDTAAATEGVGILVVRGRVLSDSASASETVARAQILSRTLAESSPATNVSTAVKTLSKAVSDSAPAADTVTRTVTGARGVSDSAPVVEALTRSVVATRGAPDIAAAADIVVRSQNHARSVADNASATDSTGRATMMLRNVTDSAPAALTQITSTARPRAISDTAAATDSVVKSLMYARTTRDFLRLLNLVDNPRGESVAGWQRYGTAGWTSESVISDAGWSVEGAASLHYIGTNSSGNNAGRSGIKPIAVGIPLGTSGGRFPVVPGFTYYVEAWINVIQRSGTGQTQLFIDYWTNAQAFISQTSFVADAPTSTGVQKISGFIVPPATTAYVDFDMLVGATIGNQSEFYMDQIMIVQADVAVLFADTSPNQPDQVTSVKMLPRSITDTASATEGVTRSTVVVRTGMDNAPAIESMTKFATRTRSPSDTASAVDSVTRFAVYTRAVEDSVGATDGETHFRLLGRSTADSAPASEAVSRSSVLARVTPDTAAASDSVTRNLVQTRSGTNSAPSVDSVARSAVHARTTSDSAGAIDVVTRVIVYLRGVGDPAPSSENVIATSGLSASGSDTVSATDTVTRTVVASRGLNDAAPSIAVPTTTSSFSRGTGDSAGSTDTVTRVGAFSRAVIDIASGAESVIRSVVASRNLGETTSLSDAVLTTTGGSIPVNESAPASETVFRTAAFTRGTADTATGSDALSRTAYSFIFSTDTAPVSEGNSGSSGSTTGGSDSAPASGFLSRSVIYERSIFNSATANATLVVIGGILPGSGIPGHFGSHGSGRIGPTDSPGHFGSDTPGHLETAALAGHLNPASPGRRERGNLRDSC